MIKFKHQQTNHLMHKKLIVEAFNKAKLLRKKSGEKKPSAINMAEDLSDFINENEDFRLGERSFRDYRNDAEKQMESPEDINIKQLKVVNGLCRYLGFDTYEAFVSRNHTIPNHRKLGAFIIKNKLFLLVFLIIVCAIIMMTSINQQRWMVWQNDHYEEVNFDAETYNLGQLKLYNESRINAFKKATPDCNTVFFSPDGTIKIWYGKNTTKELEFFTTSGKHPETGKTLDPITAYMIKKYLCKDY